MMKVLQLDRPLNNNHDEGIVKWNQQINNKHDEGVTNKPRPWTHYIKLLLDVMWKNHLFKHMGIGWKTFGKKLTIPILK